MRSIITVLISLLITTSAQAYTRSNSTIGPAVNVDRSLVINSIIAGGNILGLAPAILAMAADDSDEPIDLIINSPGGEVTTGFLFINVMEQAKQMGATIRCFVPGMAASMAFQILIHCDERYTLNKSFLLWHRARTMSAGAVTAVDATELARQLQSLDTVILDECESALGLDFATVTFHFEQQTLHVGSNLAAMAPKFIQSFDAIPGLMDALTGRKTPHAPIAGSAQFRPGSLIYMYTGPVTHN